MSLRNGTIYRWNRPVYAAVDGRPHLRVENRVLPAGPSVADILANAAFYYGLVRVLAEEQNPVWTELPFATAAENLRQAARYGMGARLWAARHHRAALPDRPNRGGLADRHGRGAHPARNRPAAGIVADDRALHRAHAHQRARPCLAGRPVGRITP
jgi:hypothetical protein